MRERVPSRSVIRSRLTRRPSSFGALAWPARWSFSSTLVLAAETENYGCTIGMSATARTLRLVVHSRLQGQQRLFPLVLEGAAATAASPADCSRGSWRSPNVEQIQLKRRLDLQFVATDGGLIVTGDDASTAIIPDQSCRVVFDKILWVEDGMHHGKPCYKGVDRPEPKPAANTTASGNDKSTMLVLVCGVAIGVGVVLAAQRWRGA